MKCNNCGADLADNAKFCTSCGASVENTAPQGGSRHCPNCGSELAEGASFCTNCGQKVTPAAGKPSQGIKDDLNKAYKKLDPNLKKILILLTAGFLTALLVIFLVLPMFGGGKFSAKKAAGIVEDVFEEAMDYDFEDARKYFSITAQDEADYFFDIFQGFKTYYGDYVDKTLDDLIDIEVEPVDFLYNRNTKAAKGTFKVISKVKKKHLSDPMISQWFGSDFKGIDTDTVDVEFMKEGKKWVITSID